MQLRWDNVAQRTWEHVKAKPENAAVPLIHLPSLLAGYVFSLSGACSGFTCTHILKLCSCAVVFQMLSEGCRAPCVCVISCCPNTETEQQCQTFFLVHFRRKKSVKTEGATLNQQSRIFGFQSGQVSHGKAEQQAKTGGPRGFEAEHWVFRWRDPGVVQRLLEGLSLWSPVSGRVQKDLRKLFPVWGRIKVRWTRISHIWHERRRDNRLPRVHLCTKCDFSRKAGTEAQVGLFDVRSGRQWIN